METDIRFTDNKNFVDDLLDADFNEQIKKSFDKLTTRQREVIMLYYGFYGKRYKQPEIAEMFSVSQSYISRVLISSLKKLKVELQQICEDNLINNDVKPRKKYLR